MRCIIVFLLCLTCSLNVARAQVNIDELTKAVNETDLKKMVYYLSSKDLEGRYTGEKGQKIAANFIRTQFEALGVTPFVQFPDYLQEFQLLRSTPKKMELTINGIELNRGKDFEFFGEVNMHQVEHTLMQYIDTRKTLPNDIKGKTVVVDQNYLKPDSIDRLQDLGANAIFVILEGTLQEFRKGYSLSGERETYLRQINAPKATSKAVFYIGRNIWQTISQNKEDKLEVKYLVQREEKIINTENVVGYIEGSEFKDEFVVVTAHYDHMGVHKNEVLPGADDNASGVACILEIADAFMQAKSFGFSPKRSVLFVAFTGEEQGLFGSDYFVKNTMLKTDQFVANLNIDMLGRIAHEYADFEDYVYLVGSDRISKKLHDLSETTNANHTKLELDYTYNDEKHPDQVYYRSDHWSFAKHGVPSIFYFSGVTDDYHSPTDTADKINYRILAKRTKLVFLTAWFLANGNSI